MDNWIVSKAKDVVISFNFHIVGKSESSKDKLRSILAQFEFQQRVLQWEDEGVHSRSHLYGPEVHPETNEVFC